MPPSDLIGQACGGHHHYGEHKSIDPIQQAAVQVGTDSARAQLRRVRADSSAHVALDDVLALGEFFAPAPTDIGAAFVVVSHQPSGHVSLLPDLLQKHTRMPVVEATDGMRLAPNHVYLSMPGRTMAMLQGVLHVMDRDSDGHLALPIDYFFRSLADDQGERAIGVVLSGTGTDGTLGLKAIKAHAGMTMAMHPACVAFGTLEPTLQVQIVGRKLSRLASHKHPWFKAAHHLGKRLLNGIRAGLPLLLQRDEPRLTLCPRGRGARPQDTIHCLQVLGVETNLRQGIP